MPAPTTRESTGVLLVIALGGMLGAGARYGLELAVPHASADVPWATLIVNVSGCLLIGMLMVQVVEVGRAHRLLRPFVGVGVLGGYTTFSSVSVQVNSLLLAQRPVVALGYLFGTLAAALLAVTTGVWVARSLVRGRRRLRRRKAHRRSRAADRAGTR
jgi:fluoride exporter